MADKVRRRAWRFVTAALGVLSVNVVLLAQDPKEFKPISDLAEPQVSASPFILAAYGFVWVAVFVYVFLLWRRLGRVEHELADVNAQLVKRARR